MSYRPSGSKQMVVLRHKSSLSGEKSLICIIANLRNEEILSSVSIDTLKDISIIGWLVYALLVYFIHSHIS